MDDPYIHITHHRNGQKMHGFISINTSQYLNEYCQKQCKNERSVCKYCYARNMELNYIRLRKHLERNFYRLSDPLSDQELIDLSRQIRMENKHYIRFNSLGELTGINHLMNIYRICESLPDLKFGLWSKRINLFRKTLSKPDNLSLIYSNPIIDQPVETYPDPFNGVFNVVTYDYALNNLVIPNCYGQCISCLKCYQGTPVVITELIKHDQRSIDRGFLKPLSEVV